MRSILMLVLCATLAVLLLLPATAGAEGYVYVDQWGSAGTSAGQFASGSTGVATDRFGTVWAVSNGDGRMERFSLGGAFSSQFASGCDNSWGIAVDHSGNVYAADWTLDRIRVFDQSGAVLLSFGSLGTGKVQFNNPLGIDVADDGTIYVADCYNHRVQVFDSTGGWLNTWGAPGTGEGEFSYPAGIVVDDAAGEVYVADNGNDRIQVFDLTGTYQREFGKPGSGDGGLSGPYGLAFDGDKYILVADSGNERVARFNTKGQWVSSLGRPGSGDGEFSFPTDVAIDADGALYVSEDGNPRVQKFAYDDTAPVLAHDYDGEWHSQPFTVHFSATDDVTAVPWLRWSTDGGSNWTNNGSIPVPAPTTHAWDGVFKPMIGAGDSVSNWAYRTLNIKIDTRDPISTVSGVPGGWTNQAVTAHIVATDAGSGVDDTYYDLDGAGLTELPASGDLLIDTAGQHSLQYWSEDNCADTPNQEAPKTVNVYIDEMGPSAFPRYAVTVRRGGNATFKYGLVDDLSPSCTVKLVIRKKTKIVKTVALGVKDSAFQVPEHFYSTPKVRISLPAGVYNWTVSATDLAGNVGSYAPKKLTVRP